jgi:hypothetical protein
MWAEFPQTPILGLESHTPTRQPTPKLVSLAINLRIRGNHHFWSREVWSIIFDNMLIKNKKPSTEAKTDNYPVPPK